MSSDQQLADVQQANRVANDLLAQMEARAVEAERERDELKVAWNHDAEQWRKRCALVMTERDSLRFLLAEAQADRERWRKALGKIAGPHACVVSDSGWVDDFGKPETPKVCAIRARLHRANCPRCLARAALDAARQTEAKNG